MMTKRLRVLLLAGVAVLSMAAFYGCGGTDDSTTDSSTGSYSSSDTENENADSSTDSSDNSDKNNEDANSDNGTNSSGSFDTAGDADAA